MQSMHMLRPQLGGDAVGGPFVEIKTLQAVLSEMAKLAIQFGEIVSKFFPVFNPDEAIENMRNGAQWGPNHRYWKWPDDKIKKKAIKDYSLSSKSGRWGWENFIYPIYTIWHDKKQILSQRKRPTPIALKNYYNEASRKQA